MSWNDKVKRLGGQLCNRNVSSDREKGNQSRLTVSSGYSDLSGPPRINTCVRTIVHKQTLGLNIEHALQLPVILTRMTSVGFFLSAVLSRCIRETRCLQREKDDVQITACENAFRGTWTEKHGKTRKWIRRYKRVEFLESVLTHLTTNKRLLGTDLIKVRSKESCDLIKGNSNQVIKVKTKELECFK